MLDDRQVEWLRKQSGHSKEEIERMWLSYMVPENATVTASPYEDSRWDATVTTDTIEWWCENKMRFVSEWLVLHGGGGKPAGLLTDLSKVEFLYNTGNGLLIHYFPREECCYIVRVQEPSSYVQDTGWYPKNNYSDELEWKTVCFIPVTEKDRRKINIKEIMRNAKRD